MTNTMYEIKLHDDADFVAVKTRKSQVFEQFAQKLKHEYGGECEVLDGWWMFPFRLRDQIERKCTELWGAPDDDMLHVEITAAKRLECQTVMFGNREIVHMGDMDDKPRLANGVVRLDGAIGTCTAETGPVITVAKGSQFVLAVSESVANRVYSDWTVKQVDVGFSIDDWDSLETLQAKESELKDGLIETKRRLNEVTSDIAGLCAKIKSRRASPSVTSVSKQNAQKGMRP